MQTHDMPGGLWRTEVEEYGDVFEVVQQATVSGTAQERVNLNKAQALKLVELIQAKWGKPAPAPMVLNEVDMEREVLDFHEAFGLDIDVKQNVRALVALRRRLHNEEARELDDELACFYINRAALLKECVDLVYVTIGHCVALGLPFAEAWARVHQNNMSKLQDGKPVFDQQGKVMKPEGYQPVDLRDLVGDE